MFELDFHISGSFAGKLKVDPVSVSSEGGPEYPRLIIPLMGNLSPIKEYYTGDPDSLNVVRNYVVLNIECDLLLNNRKIASATKGINRTVRFPNDSQHINIEFPLDPHRIEKIEENRNGKDLEILLQCRIASGVFDSFRIQNAKGEQIKKDFILAIEPSNISFPIKIPRSHWIEKILPGLGYGKIKLIEIPVASKIISEAFQESLNELSLAQNYFNSGDYDKSVAHCRSAIEPIKKKLIELKENIDSNSESKWVQGITTATHDWLETLDKQTRRLTSKTHHIPSVGHFSRNEAEVIMLVVIALVAYTGRLTPSNPPPINNKS